MNKLNRIIMACALACCCAPQVAANKIELGDAPAPKIYNHSKDAPKVKVTEVALTYAGSGSEPANLVIVEQGGDTLYNNSVKSGLTPDELSHQAHIYFYADKSYTITHGSHTWTVGAKVEDNVGADHPADESKGTPWWPFAVIGVLVLACIALGAMLWRINRVAAAAPQKNESKPETPETPETPEAHKPAEAEVATSKVPDQAEAVKEVLNQIYPAEELNSALHIERIKQLISNGADAKNIIEKVQQALGIDSDDAYFLCKKIDDLKALKDLKEQTADDIIHKIREKKSLNSLLNNASKDAGVTAPSYDVLVKFVQILAQKLDNGKEAEPVVASSVEITEAQLRNSANAHILKRWLLDLLKDAKISVDNPNETAQGIVNAVAQQLADAKQAVQAAAPSRSAAEIVTDYIIDNKLTPDQNRVLLRRLIERINAALPEQNRLGERIDIPEFVNQVAAAFTQPSSFEDAEANVRSRDLAVVNDALDSNLEALSVPLVSQAVTAMVMKQLPGYDVDSIAALPKAIQEKQAADMLKSVAADVEKLLPGEHPDSTQKLVNALIKKARQAQESADLVASDLKERITERDAEFVAPDNADLLNLIDKFSQLVASKESTLSEQIASDKAEIQTLTSSVAAKNTQIESLQTDKAALMAETQRMIHTLHSGAEQILDACKPILKACSDDDEAQCIDIEDRLFAAMNDAVTALKAFGVAPDTTPADARKAIQQCLAAAIAADNSPINTICRYYAYSRLPFMTDASREYGVMFNRKNMAELYHAIETLYVHFGINLHLPMLFVMGVDEGEFENVTGQTYGDLDNLCQNSRNHYDNIDSGTKPANVIVDVVNVGFTIDGTPGRLTSVLTY